MGPTPEPLPSGGLSDEEMPQQPPIFLSSSDEDDEEVPVNPDYPPGYMPIAHHVQIEWASDSEESDGDAEPVAAAAAPPRHVAAAALETGVQAEQAATAPDEAQPEDDIDYNSLAGLMAALAAHGPNQAEEPCGLQTAYLHDSDSESTATGPPRTRRRPAARLADSTRTVAAAAATTAQTDPSQEVIDPSLSTFGPDHEVDRLPLDSGQEAAVLRAMQGFTLPASAIPAWASDLPDTVITTLVRDKIGRPAHNENN